MSRANSMSNTHRSPAPAKQVPVSQHKPTKVLKKASSSLDTDWQQKTLQSKDWDQNSSRAGGEKSRSLKRLIYIQGTSRSANNTDKEIHAVALQNTRFQKVVSLTVYWFGEKIKKRKDYWYYWSRCWRHRKRNSNELLEFTTTTTI